GLRISRSILISLLHRPWARNSSALPSAAAVMDRIPVPSSLVRLNSVGIRTLSFITDAAVTCAARLRLRFGLPISALCPIFLSPALLSKHVQRLSSRTGKPERSDRRRESVYKTAGALR